MLPDATVSAVTHGAALHQVSPFAYTATGAGDISFSGDADQLRTFVATIRQQGGKVLPAITDGMSAGGMAAVIADPTSRTRHVRAVAALAEQNGFDGIDIDYEQFAFTDNRATWATTRPNWAAFIAELATALHDAGRLLTVSIPPIYDTGRTADSGYWVYDYPAMGMHVDGIRIMAYDYSTDEPGPIAPLSWVRGVVKAAKKAVGDDSKLVLGIPLYGRNWVVATSGTCPADAPGKVDPNLHEVDALLAQYGATPLRDEVTQESTFTYQRDSTDGSTGCTQTREVHYMDALGVRARVDLAREERIGGVVFWALGYDTDASWTAVADVVRPRVAASTAAP